MVVGRLGLRAGRVGRRLLLAVGVVGVVRDAIGGVGDLGDVAELVVANLVSCCSGSVILLMFPASS
jgi:hypothetical protein